MANNLLHIDDGKAVPSSYSLTILEFLNLCILF